MTTLRSRMILLTAVAVTLLAGCGPQQAAGPQVAIIDLSVVARETGQDVVIRERAEEGITELNGQLQQLAATLDEQLAAERERIGVAPNEEQAERLQQLAAQARQQVNQAQLQAQQQANDLESQLVAEFRDELTPLAEAIAAKLGATLILSKDIFIFWADDSVDITDEVVAAWQAQQPATPEPAAAAPAESSEPAASEPAADTPTPAAEAPAE